MSLTPTGEGQRILETAFAFRTSRTLLTAVELGVFTELGKGPRSCAQLCRALGLDEQAVPDLLDALVALGLLERDGENARAIYLNTRAGARLLDANGPASLESVLQQAGHAWGAWGELTALMRYGRRTALRERDSLVASVRRVLDRFDPAHPSRVLDLSLPRGLVRASLPVRQRRQVMVRSARAGRLPAADSVVMAGLWQRLDGRSTREVLARIRRSLRDGGNLIVIEPLQSPPYPSEPLQALDRRVDGKDTGAVTASDIEMACRHGGFARTEVMPLEWPIAAVIACKDASTLR